MKITKIHGLLLGLGVMGATALASATTSAQAAPRFEQVQYRRGYNYRNNDYRNNRYRNNNYRNRDTFQVITGRVTRDYAGNSFLLRTDRGSTYRVTVVGGEPRRLSVGDRVQVSGSYRNGSFRAQRFTLLRNR